MNGQKVYDEEDDNNTKIPDKIIDNLSKDEEILYMSRGNNKNS